MAAISQTTFWNEFVPNGSIDNIPALVQIMAPNRRQAIIWTNDGYRHIYASLGINELISAFFSVRETALGTQIIYSGLMMREFRGSLFPKWQQPNTFAFWFWYETSCGFIFLF